MKLFLLPVLLCLATAFCGAQIPNPGFEYWNNGNPNLWHSTNSQSLTYISQSDTTHEGMYGLRSSVVTSGGFHTISPLWSTNPTGSTYFFPCDCRPDALRFWYRLHPTGGEAIVATISGKQVNLGMAGNSLTFANATDVYTEAVLPVYYTQGDNVDSMTIVFSMQGSPGAADYHQGAYYMIDDLSWGSITNVDEQAASAAVLEYVFPNPARDVVSFVYNLPQAAQTRLAIYDALGREALVVLEEKQAAGRYKAMPNVSFLANGVYTARLEVNGLVANKSFTVSR